MINPNSWYTDQTRRTDLHRAAQRQQFAVSVQQYKPLRRAVGAWMVKTGQHLQRDEPNAVQRQTMAS